MNLKEEFFDILRRYGHDVIIQRRVHDKASGPFMEVDGDLYSAVAERWTSYRWFPGPRMRGKAGDNLMYPEGNIIDYDAIFYLQPDAKPKRGDLLTEPTPHERAERQTYRIEFGQPYYMGRELIYFAALCNKVEPN